MKSEIKIHDELFISEFNAIRHEKEHSNSSINSNEIEDIEKIVMLLEKLNEEKITNYELQINNYELRNYGKIITD